MSCDDETDGYKPENGDNADDDGVNWDWLDLNSELDAWETF